VVATIFAEEDLGFTTVFPVKASQKARTYGRDKMVHTVLIFGLSLPNGFYQRFNRMAIKGMLGD
jgi:hypothetical protein